jgi:hypothetical protein
MLRARLYACLCPLSISTPRAHFLRRGMRSDAGLRRRIVRCADQSAKTGDRVNPVTEEARDEDAVIVKDL